jgi:hypothetical protein
MDSPDSESELEVTLGHRFRCHGFGFSLFHIFMSVHELLPNKSPEPTAVGAGSSAIAVHAASRRWLSFFR